MSPLYIAKRDDGEYEVSTSPTLVGLPGEGFAYPV